MARYKFYIVFVFVFVRPKISEDSMLLPVTRYGKRLIDACNESSTLCHFSALLILIRVKVIWRKHWRHCTDCHQFWFYTLEIRDQSVLIYWLVELWSGDISHIRSWQSNFWCCCRMVSVTWLQL